MHDSRTAPPSPSLQRSASAAQIRRTDAERPSENTSDWKRGRATSVRKQLPIWSISVTAGNILERDLPLACPRKDRLLSIVPQVLLPSLKQHFKWLQMVLHVLYDNNNKSYVIWSISVTVRSVLKSATVSKSRKEWWFWGSVNLIFCPL